MRQELKNLTIHFLFRNDNIYDEKLSFFCARDALLPVIFTIKISEKFDKRFSSSIVMVLTQYCLIIS